MKKLLFLLFSICAVTAQAQISRPAAEHKIDSLIPSNQVRIITPERIRKALGVSMDYAKQLDTIGSKKLIGELDIVSGKAGLVLGADNGLNTRTDSTTKYARILTAPWANWRRGYAMMSGYAYQNAGYVYIGGGNTYGYAVNYIQEYTTPEIGTTGGQIRRVVNPDGSHWFGPSPLMDGVNLATFNGAVNVKGTLTTQALEPVQSGTYRIGSSSLNYGTGYIQQLISNGSTLNLRVPASSGIYFNQSATVGDATKVVGGFYPSTGEHFIQAPGTATTNNGYRFQNYGTSYLGGDVAITGTTTFTAPWADYQATFGQTNQAGRIQLMRGNDGVQGLRIGFNSAANQTSEIVAANALNVTANLLALTSNGSTSPITISAIGVSGQIRFQTGSTESGRVFTNGNWRIGSSGVDDGKKVQIEGAAGIEGTLTTQGIVPIDNVVRDIGSGTNQYNSVRAALFVSNGGTVQYGGLAANTGITFRQGSGAQLSGGFFGSGRFFIQPTGAFPVDDNVNQLQVTGSAITTQYRLSSLNVAPASATAPGTLGEIRVTAGYIYVCTATNTWVRSALATW